MRDGEAIRPSIPTVLCCEVATWRDDPVVSWAFVCEHCGRIHTHKANPKGSVNSPCAGYPYGYRLALAPPAERG